MNESMLTGESISVLKSALQSNDQLLYNPNEEGKRSTLFAGTRCIEVKHIGEAPVIALVSKTGFGTLKGYLHFI
jgi:cation-transporting ATPase 13A3/4/5